MNIEQHTIDPLNAELTIHIQPADYNDRFEKAIKDYRKKLQLPGFRPGQVPANLVKKRFGKSLLAEEINHVLQDAIHHYINEQRLEILGNPIPKGSDENVGNWDEPGDFKFHYELGLSPNIEVPLTKEDVFVMLKPIIDDTLLEKQMKDMARRYGQMSQPEISAEDDMLFVKLEQLDDQNEILQGGITNDTTVTVEYIIDADTKKSLIGLKKSDAVIVDPVKLSENHEDLAKMLGITHHDVHHLSGMFKLTVNEVNHLDPHELNAELFEKFYGAEIQTLEQFKEKVRSEMNKAFEQDSKWLFRKQFIGNIVEKVNPALPDEFLKKWIMLTNEKPMSVEELDYIYPSQAFQLKWQLIQNKITRDHQVRVEMQEALDYVKNSMKKQFESYNIPAEEEMIEKSAKNYMADREKATKIYESLHDDKVISLALELCKIEDKFIPFNEFVHIMQHI